jgi:hypothetical protein
VTETGAKGAGKKGVCGATKTTAADDERFDRCVV